MLAKKEVVARPAGVYAALQVKRLDWLAGLFSVTGFRQTLRSLASGPMGDCRLHTGPTSNALEVRRG